MSKPKSIGSVFPSSQTGSVKPVKKQRVLLAPATQSPKREAIRAAVEKVAAEREQLASL
jgi:hypothetical protein